MVSVYYMAILSKSKLFYICKHLHFCHITINDMAQRDPVCNMMVDEKKTQHISEVNGQKVYLCSASCKNQFDQNPGKYGY
jgi:YHS domain-containing protein